MNNRSLAISILQKARDTLGDRLTERVVESRQEIDDDAEGRSYLSEIESIYEQLGGRLAHLNAMLANLPSVQGPSPADSAASEMIYADLASAYPTSLDLEAAAPVPLLALPAPAAYEQQLSTLPGDGLQDVAVNLQAGDLATASRLISELFDIKPSQALRYTESFSRRLASDPAWAARMVELGDALGNTTNHAAAALLCECFEIPSPEALTIVHTLRRRCGDVDPAT